MDLVNKRVCLICFNKIKNNIEGLEAEEAEKIFRSCLVHLHTAIANSTTTLNDRLNQSRKFQPGGNQLPFCKTCFDTAVKLTKMSEHLDNFKKEFSDFSVGFSMSVLQRRSHCGEVEDEDEEDVGEEEEDEKEVIANESVKSGSDNASPASSLSSDINNSDTDVMETESDTNSTATITVEEQDEGTVTPSSSAAAPSASQVAQIEESEKSKPRPIRRSKVEPRKMVLPEEAQKCISKKLKYALTTYQTYCQSKDLHKKTSFITQRLEQLKISKCPSCGCLKGSKPILLALHILKQECPTKSK